VFRLLYGVVALSKLEGIQDVVVTRWLSLLLWLSSLQAGRCVGILQSDAICVLGSHSYMEYLVFCLIDVPERFDKREGSLDDLELSVIVSVAQDGLLGPLSVLE